MMKRLVVVSAQLLALVLFASLPFSIHAQDRLKGMPGAARYGRVTRQMTNLFQSGALTVTWKDGGRAFEYSRNGVRHRYDIASGLTSVWPKGSTNSPASTNEPARRSRGGTGGTGERIERGRQYTYSISPDGQWRAFYRDRNLWLGSTNGQGTNAITTDGSERSRLKFGSASWVYGEELYQNTAMWWSSNSQKIAFYRFDESQVRDFPLTLNMTKIHSTLDVEPYVKAGDTNPTVDLFIHDLKSKKTVRVDVRDGKAFDDAVVGHYVYDVFWAQDDSVLLFHRANRRQNVTELVAADPETGKCRVVVREEWPASWAENSPPRRFLKDGQRFIWNSERTGWRNFYLYHLDGRLLATLTQHSFEVANIVQVDEDRSFLYYMARSGDNPMKLQLHRVGLDGRGDVRLTDPTFHHTVSLAPDGGHFIDVIQTHDTPPVTRLVNADGKVIKELAASDMTRFDQLGLKRVELLKFKAADGETELYGMLHFPSNFNPNRKYPLLVSVYAGPATAGARETFTQPDRLTEYGFLVASFDSRSASGRGKKFLDSIYMKLGTVEIDDQAAGVRALGKRRYVDRRHVGIFGTSYGGTASALCLLRYPDVFHAAASSSSVGDFRHYDSIYTERYLWLPQENKAGYDAVALTKHATNLQGRLMIFYGTADNNVHPNNSLEFIKALQRAGKSFEVQVGPDEGHAAVNRERMMEFFIENLVLK